MSTVDEGQGYKVVMRLLEGMHGKAYIVVMDNFFTSVKLLHDLYGLGTYATGTIRVGRKGLPRDLVSKLHSKVGSKEI